LKILHIHLSRNSALHSTAFPAPLILLRACTLHSARCDCCRTLVFETEMASDEVAKSEVVDILDAPELTEQAMDVIVLGTGLAESVLAAYVCGWGSMCMG
jgi:hypothetical protein